MSDERKLEGVPVRDPLGVSADGAPGRSAHRGRGGVLPVSWLRSRRMALLYGVILAYNLLVWADLGRLSRQFPGLIPLGLLAFVLGMKHAFDADHIAAIDNTTRKLMNDGQRPLGVGFYFSLGHSTIVFILAMGLAVATGLVQHGIQGAENVSGVVGTGVSAVFLYFIAALNLVVLVGIYDAFRRVRRGGYDPARLEELLARRGFMNRYFGRLFRTIRKSSQMYLVGFLFGLGFDTATEMAVIGMAALAATRHLPLDYIVILPLLFAGGMTLMDTTDGVVMLHAYAWAFRKPIRKVFYNLVITTISVAIALIIGTVELLQVLSSEFSWHGRFWDTLQNLSFGELGYVIVGILLVSWALAILVYRLRGYEREAPSSPS